jgi:hypothetical protein
VTLPEVVTGELAGKFGEISLFDQHADFELGSASNSSSTSPWAIVCEPATQPSHVDSPPRERFTRGPRNVGRAGTKAPTTRQAGKEPVPKYDSDSDTAPGHASDSNPLFDFYSDSAYEFDFRSDPEEPESDDNSTEQPLSGPASGLVITSTPAGRFVYWPGRKPADLTNGNSRCVAYLDSLPFQEGTPLAPAGEHTPTEVATSDSSLGSPDRQIFMTTNETPGPSGTVPDQYLEDISAEKLSANAPANETPVNRDARREHNKKRNERRRRLRDSLPIRNLAEALDQVESRAHTTPEQCLMSITTIARQAQGMRAGQVIAKLAEDAYFMRVNIGRNRTQAELPANPNLTRATAGGPSQGGNSAQLLTAIARSSLIATLVAEAATAEAPTTGLTGGPVAGAITAAEATRTATSPEPHRAASMPARRLKNYGARRSPRQATTTASLPSPHDFATSSSQRNSSL